LTLDIAKNIDIETDYNLEKIALKLTLSLRQLTLKQTLTLKKKLTVVIKYLKVLREPETGIHLPGKRILKET